MLRTRLAVLLCSGLCLGLAGACSGSRPSQEGGGEPTARPAPAAPGAPGTGLAPPDPREAHLVKAVVKLLEDEHIRHHRIDDKVSRAAFDQYLKHLDPGKVFLLESDVAALRKEADEIDDQLHAGRLDLAHDGAAAYHARLAVVQKIVAELLAQPFDSTNAETIELDADKLAFAKTDAELRERWRQRLELEVLERVAAMEERLAAKAKEDAKAKPADKAGAKGKKPGKAPAAGAATPPSAPGAPVIVVEPGADPETAAAAATPVRGEIPATPEGREAKARGDLAVSYQARFTRLGSPDKLAAAADLLDAVAAMFDPHTNYLPPDDKANFDIAMSGSLEGIGAVLREDDHLISVVEIVPGGASWRQGILDPGDRILSVTQQNAEPVDVTDMRIDEVVAMIRGPRGTVVTLSVQKPTGEILTVPITRDVIVIEEAYARGAVLKPKGGKRSYGYIHLPSFYGGRGANQRTASSDVHKLLADMAGRKVAGVILDLRGNGGGLLGDAVEMTGLFIDKGPVVETQRSDGHREILSDDEPGTTYDGPVIVMVDRFSASASEILAGALQDYQRAVIVGTGPTHGKGTVQVIADLDRVSGGSDLGVLKLTIQQFFRVSGASTQWQGVVPGVVLPDPAGHLETGERHLENSLPYSAIEALPHADWKATWNLAELTARSAARVTKNDALSKVAARTAYLKARHQDTTLPLARTAWVALRAQRRAELEANTPHLDEGPPRFGVTLLDGGPAVAARPGGKADDRVGQWRDNLGRDPWLEETLSVLDDMTSPAVANAAH